MSNKETLVARARVIASELNKTLEALANEGVTVDYCAYSKTTTGADSMRFELEFAEITRVKL